MPKFTIVTETGSTNDDVLALGRQGAAHGTALLALSQRQGRGRLGRSWHSPTGIGLYGSVLLRPHIARESYPRLTLVAGVAAVTAIEAQAGLLPRLKWPNDLYLDGKKCGGILTEAVFTGTGDYAVVGIGINLGAFSGILPEDLRHRAGVLWQTMPPPYHAESLFAVIHEQLLTLVGEYENHGLAQILAQWRRRDGFYGQQLAWAGPNGAKIIGKSAGIDEEGDLLLVDAGQRLHTINCGDVQPAAA